MQAKLVCAVVVFFAAGHAQQEDSGAVTDPDLAFITQFVTANARIEGFAGAGCALLEGITAVHVNPALPNAYNKAKKTRHFIVHTGYGRDSLFDENTVPGGISCYLGEPGTIGLLFRYLQRDDHQQVHEGVFNYSGRMFDKSIDQGAVDFGINLRYERIEWETFDHAPLYKYAYARDSSTAPFSIDTLAVSDRVERGKTRGSRLMFDLGFVQKGVAERLDFGMTFHDLLGYSWLRERPYIKNEIGDSVRVDTLNEYLYYTDSLYYAREYKKRESWCHKKYKRMTVGIAYHPGIMQNKVQLSIPADVGFVGLFDRDTKTRFSLRVGVEAQFLKHYMLRFGYGRAPRVLFPGDLDGDSNPNTNIFTGGGGVRIQPFAADIFIGKQSWGVGIGVAL
ncbi:MAG: hypothetical protein GF350_12935 [Chitinivibrionales bacterium]|nr:hypothetical protein [Chitinivibrionales bacterium]